RRGFSAAICLVRQPGHQGGDNRSRSGGTEVRSPSQLVDALLRSRERCPLYVEIVSAEGQRLAALPNVPDFCKVLAGTGAGSEVCDGGCGFDFGSTDLWDEMDFQFFQCPFGVTNAICPAGEEGGTRMALLGGRILESYAQFGGLVDRALEAGLALDDLLERCGAIPFHDREYLERTLRGLAEELTKAPSAASPEAAEDRAEAASLLGPEAPQRLPGIQVASLQSFVDSLMASREPGELGRAIVRGFERITGARRISLFFFDPKGGVLVLNSSVGLPPSIEPGFRRMISTGVMSHVFSSREPAFVAEIADQSLFPPSPHGHYETNSFASMPLVVGPRCFGVLNVTDREGGEAFSDQDFEWMRLLARLASMATARLRLESKTKTDRAERLADFHRRLKEEFDRAARRKRPLCLALLRVDMTHWLRKPEDRPKLEELILKGVIDVLGRALRKYDLVARCDEEGFAGEETDDAGDSGEASRFHETRGDLLAILLPEATRQQGLKVLERVQGGVHQRFLSHVPSQECPERALSFEAGLAEYPTDAVLLQELKSRALAAFRSQDHEAEGEAPQPAPEYELPVIEGHPVPQEGGGAS
ncbi:MAG TPA: GAF domain-containing protein, partial [Sumerlaeia bacterium]|nr:GAF domain-containing protein [Sumerlaeia bacterium]